MSHEFHDLESGLEQVSSLLSNLQDEFLSLGRIFAWIKVKKLHDFKGYGSFKDFIQCEYYISASLANRLAGIHSVFVNDLDMDTDTLMEIGYDRLSLILPLVKKGTTEQQDLWIGQAKELGIDELKRAIKAYKDQAKILSPKQELVTSWLDRMMEVFNCSKAELLFKLALFFTAPTKNNDEYLDSLKSDIRRLQRDFEAQLNQQSNQQPTSATQAFYEACQDLVDSVPGCEGVTMITPNGNETVIASKKHKGASHV